MRKTIKKILSITLSVIMLIGSLSAFAFAAESKKNDIPIIFVDGIASTDIVNTENGEIVFPPSAKSIISGVSGAVAPLISGLISKDYSELGEPLNKAIKKIFKNVACDENGVPIYPTTSTYERQTSEEIAEKYTDELGYTAANSFYFSYDWRLNMTSLSTQLHDYIEFVLNKTGAEKVNLIGFSMGTCVVMTYLKDFDYQYVDGVILMAGGYNGVSTCGEPFSGRLDFSSESMVRFINTMLGFDFGSYILEAIIDALYQSGIIDGAIDIAKNLTDAVLNDMYTDSFQETFARMAGFWSLIPYDLYDDAKALLISDNVSDEFIAEIDHFHYDIQAHNEDIINEALAKGINFGIIAKYGFVVPPCIESIDNIGDTTIDTVFESFGATCSTADTTLGKDYIQAVNDGHNHISADLLIDASTCRYPEYTWFIKGLKHAEHDTCEWELCDFILNSESQPTVWDSEAYSQYLIYLNGKLEPLTEENDQSRFGDVTEKEDSFIGRIIHVLKLILKAFKALFKK